MITTANEAKLYSNKYGILNKYNKIVNKNLLKIQKQIFINAREGVYCVTINIEEYLYPSDTIKALREFGYEVERNAYNQLNVSWYKS